MKIAIGTDHAAFEFKNKAIDYLKAKGFEIEDFGPYDSDDVDYPDYVYPAAKAVADGDSDLGIVMCGTGIGANIVANKVKGIRAALVYDPEIAKITKLHNNSNVLVLGPRFTDEKTLFEIIDNWLATDYKEEERHKRRLTKIKDVEENER